MEYVLGLVLVLLLLFFFYNCVGIGRKRCCRAKSSFEYMDHMTDVQKHTPNRAMDVDYLETIAHEIASPKEHFDHDIYVGNRKKNGDHTKRVEPDISNRVINSNYVGLRRPRVVNYDVHSALQLSDPSQKDSVQPGYVRLQ